MKKVLDIMSRYARFNYTMLIPADKQWGTLLPNGSFTGLIGMLSRNETDIALGPLTITYERRRVANFSKLFQMMHLTILGGNMKESRENVFGYILTFDWKVWLLFLISLIATIIVSSFMEFLLECGSKRMITLKSKLIRYFWAYLGTAFCESMPTVPTYISVRIVLIIWWMAVIVLMNGFSSNMKAQMLLRPESERIDSVQDLIDRPYIRPIIMKGTAYETYLKSSSSETIQKLWEIIKKKNGLIFSYEMYSKAVLKEVALGKSVYLADPVSLKYFIGKNCKDMGGATFYFSRETFHPHTFTIAYRKDLTQDIVKYINLGISKLFEGGVFYKMADRINHEFNKCTDDETQKGEKT
ncbi:probable glutamate receptor [Centruroides sculpturatus]|uniref:probable glutamate receptor n=1 Tax=Centruroides sculpturatus TaxID=218467 RepID=UPI000C6E289A|nr:probable glutamate receptor [Centruroides sculpturatus]